LVTYTYDDLGRRVSLLRGNGSVTNYSFDSASRLTSMSHDLPGAVGDQSLTFEYNAAGQISKRRVTGRDIGMKNAAHPKNTSVISAMARGFLWGNKKEVGQGAGRAFGRVASRAAVVFGVVLEVAALANVVYTLNTKCK
jgi:YD repeat-containing protein